MLEMGMLLVNSFALRGLKLVLPSSDIFWVI